MAKLKVNCKEDQILVKSKLNNMEQINPNEMQIFSTKLIRGLMRPNIMGGNKIIYSSPGGIPLDKFIKKGIGKNDFYLIVAQLNETAKKIENNKLNPSNLTLELQYTFINEYTKEVHFIYQPIYSSELHGNLFVFLYNLINESQFRDRVTIQCANHMAEFLKKMKMFSTEILEKYLLKVYPDVYKQIQRQKPGQSQVLSTKSWIEEENSYEESINKSEQNTLFDEGEEGTTILQDEEGTTLLEDEQGTTLLEEEQGTTVLEPQIIVSAYIMRVSTMEQAEIDKTPFRIGKERKKVDFYVRNNTAVSREHADILRKDDLFFIKDNDSTNKSYVNGEVITPQKEIELSDGDKITLANEEFEFHIEETMR